MLAAVFSLLHSSRRTKFHLEVSFTCDTSVNAHFYASPVPGDLHRMPLTVIQRGRGHSDGTFA